MSTSMTPERVLALDLAAEDDELGWPPEDESAGGRAFFSGVEARVAKVAEDDDWFSVVLAEASLVG